MARVEHCFAGMSFRRWRRRPVLGVRFLAETVLDVLPMPLVRSLTDQHIGLYQRVGG